MVDYSVIIPSYRADFETLERTVQSVLSQKYSAKEIIIIDDNGGGIFSSFIQKIEKKYADSVKVIYNEENKGANFSRNRGVCSASSTYIAFLDSDDVWNEYYLFEVAKLIEEKNAEFITTNYQVVHADGILPPEYNCKKFKSGNISKKELYGDLIGPTSTVVIKKDLILEAGLFDECLPARQDYDMWLRVTKIADIVYNYNANVKIFRCGKESISSSYLRNVKGTQIVLQKILQNRELSELEKKNIKAAHFKYMSLSCILCDAYAEGRKYGCESLKNKFDKELAIWCLLCCTPFLFSWMRKLRRFFLYQKSNIK